MGRNREPRSVRPARRDMPWALRNATDTVVELANRLLALQAESDGLTPGGVAPPEALYIGPRSG